MQKRPALFLLVSNSRKLKLKMSEAGTSKLTAADRARIERNREKALQIRATKTGKLTAQHPYAKVYVVMIVIISKRTLAQLVPFDFQNQRWQESY